MELTFNGQRSTGLEKLWEKKSLRVIGLMSGTSADGMDAALTEITGSGTNTQVRTAHPNRWRTRTLRPTPA